MCIRDRLLQEYDLKWEYIPGKKNVVADVLSRIDINKQTFEGEKESILKVYHILSNRADLESLLENLSTHQQADPKLQSIKTRLEAGDETIARYYKIHNNILFIKPSLRKETWKVIIPTHIEKEIVSNYHIRYGHMGALKVIKALEESCHLKDINRKVRKYIKSCRICQLVKSNNEKKDGQMIPITSQAKMEKVFLDICGPFPRSGGRHRDKYLCLLYTSRCV